MILITQVEEINVKVELMSLIHSSDSGHFPESRSHAFSYHVKITNQSDERVVLDARKWILAYEDGSHEIYQGFKIVGRVIDLGPNDFFDYSSYHLVERNCVVSGAYYGHSQSNENIWVRIPKFHLHIPGNME